ncbi:haloacid dehalogenase type II [Flavimarina sp. Hel_I_48]|uniref:haloacid dehalogenase type II n=1 Tax=Flavimarina sp. Hel_I_48 TaxID=1392488 RepID=UPI0004DF1FC8|nr:haloacid dehalogenase type II [Flavimarina sp. Hel_I_48]
MSTKPKLLIFDVNETLLDLKPLKEKVNEALESETGFSVWFRTLLHYSLVETTSLNYADFGEIGQATLKMVSKQFDRPLQDTEIENILSKIKELPPHTDVIEGLEQLAAQGFELAALTNGNLRTVKDQLHFAKIDHLFKGIYSVDAVQKYKPHPETYAHVLNVMNTEKENAMLVAAHGWDITGAQRAGLQTCFLERPGKFLYPLAEKPTYSIKKLTELPDLLTN